MVLSRLKSIDCLTLLGSFTGLKITFLRDGVPLAVKSRLLTQASTANYMHGIVQQLSELPQLFPMTCCRTTSFNWSGLSLQRADLCVML